MPVKILDIVWYRFLPARFGGQKGIEGFVTALSQQFEVLVLCSSNNVATGNEPFKVMPQLPVSATQFFNRGTRRLIKKICVEEKITHICIEHPYYAFAIRWLQKELKLPFIIHSHNIESERFRSMGKWWWKLMWWWEGHAHRSASKSIFKTEADRAYAIKNYKLLPENCLVLTYCLPAGFIPSDKPQSVFDTRKQYGIPADHKLLLFSGTLDYLPNARAVETIYKIIAPALVGRFSFTIIICGRNELPEFQYLKKLSHPNIMQVGFVENIEALTAAANVYINPVMQGGGIKTKIIDALGEHTPVVSFASGAIGIDTNIAGKQLQICGDEDYDQFVKLVINMSQTTFQTPDAFFELYNWDTQMDKTMKLLLEL